MESPEIIRLVLQSAAAASHAGREKQRWAPVVCLHHGCRLVTDKEVFLNLECYGFIIADFNPFSFKTKSFTEEYLKNVIL